MTPGPADSLTAAVVAFAQALRHKGLRIGTSETLDAARAVEAVGLADRYILREALALTLNRRADTRAAFDALFDLYFSAWPSPSGGAATDANLADRLASAFATHDVRLVDELATAAVAGLGEIDTLRHVDARRWSARQTLSSIDLNLVVTLALRRSRETADQVAARFEPARLAQLRSRFEQRVAAEAIQATAVAGDRARIARIAVDRPAAQRDFLNADSRQLAEIQTLVRPLAAKLAGTLSAQARHTGRGEVDLRATTRRSVAMGGVPISVVRRRRRRRPRIVVLCDMSSSVAGFSAFTAQLLHALRNNFANARIFSFVNRADEVTDILARAATDGDDLLAKILERAAITEGHHNSDYGRALDDVERRYAHALGPNVTFLVLGDARTNGTNPRIATLARLAVRSHRTYWLNPERRELWGRGDSQALAYADVVAMHECRNADQLERFVAHGLRA